MLTDAYIHSDYDDFSNGTFERYDKLDNSEQNTQKGLERIHCKSVMDPFETIIGIELSVELLSTTQEWL